MDPGFSLDRKIIRRSFNSAARDFDTAAIVQREVRTRALDRLLVLRAEPKVIVDLGAGTGHASAWLSRQFPHARVLAIDSAVGMLHEARNQQGTWRRLTGRSFVRIGGDASAIPLRAASVDWVFSNLMLPWVSEPDTLLGEIRRVLKPDGLFSFTSFGPDTLIELRESWRAADRYEHVHPFIDMHDLGDALVRAGFAEPVLDVERFTLTYSNVSALLRDLQMTGSCNALATRNRGLTSRSTFNRLASAYELKRRDSKLPATYEIVYGHSWQAPQRANPAQPTETLVPISALKRRSNR